MRSTVSLRPARWQRLGLDLPPDPKAEIPLALLRQADRVFPQPEFSSEAQLPGLLVLPQETEHEPDARRVA
jgi:hypothetical protein